jgi:hypothetical protein
MARLSAPVEQLVERFGPHPALSPPGGWTPIGEPDEV